MAYKGSYVTSCTIVDIRKKRREWQKKGKARCTKCKWLKWGYYCDKKKRSAEHIDKPKHCNGFEKL
ncbi:hypothetical protein Z965_07255 [Clostridium novyi A str. BKT29909]|uniref:hypothetical protein n=1 Tax=Clostridium novyi TaxID=1542 RepID=UPI0004D5C747|nr:hypothetical protein [Clostridium novyi]KEH86632.1 hypothetical protein Z965_07255 [Clostridium novyi A str. BKT29909]